MIAGDRFPAVVVFRNNGAYLLADGFHRLLARKFAKFNAIDTEVRQGTRLDVLKFSLAANHRHGLRRTNEDKRHSVEIALRELAEWSDRAIADLCGVSHPAVSAARRQLVKFTSCAKRLGRDEGHRWGQRFFKTNTMIKDSSNLISLILISGATASLFAAELSPPGASALGYSKRVINERPVAADIAPGESGNYKWFSGQWYAKPPSLDHYSTTNGVLTLSLDGDLVSAPHDFSPGILPPLPGDKGFYVEFDIQLSDNDPDHFPAVWLMPLEHNRKMLDAYPGDPAGFERWMELDVDEGGFGPGLAGTVHDWRGIYPKIQHSQNPNNVCQTPLDRAQNHTFGASFDPAHKRATWWVDGVMQHSSEPPYVPVVAAHQHFYLILSAQSHGKKLPYSMAVSGVRAYVPPSSALPSK